MIVLTLDDKRRITLRPEAVESVSERHNDGRDGPAGAILAMASGALHCVIEPYDVVVRLVIVVVRT